MPQSKEIQEQMRNKIVDMYKSGKGYEAISKALGLQRTPIRAIIHSEPLSTSGEKAPVTMVTSVPWERERDITENSPLWELLPFNLSWSPIGSRQSRWLANCRKACKYDELETV